ncbi:hypothetical protein [Alkalihalophilus marmarensis]|uniref:hypothetical protein n=1 Tax=Alkalihalophilus marmarensis TaxID=521377 RepID=UPI002DBAC2B1|nr:hypothetical protein [Alkalihalophilus marmarensis]MEC2071385.1 hypothetical protein [Alkalihalophilus marmarensis]
MKHFTNIKNIVLAILAAGLILSGCQSEDTAPDTDNDETQHEETAAISPERNLSEAELNLINEANARIEKFLESIVIPEVLDQQAEDYVIHSNFGGREAYSVDYYITNDELQLNYLILDEKTFGTDLKNSEGYSKVEHPINFDVYTDGRLYYLVQKDKDIYILIDSFDLSRTTFDDLTAMLGELIPPSEMPKNLLTKALNDFIAPSYRLGDHPIQYIAIETYASTEEIIDIFADVHFKTFAMTIFEEGNNPNNSESIIEHRNLVKRTVEGETLYFEPNDSSNPAVFREMGDYLYQFYLNKFEVDTALYQDMDAHYDELVKMALSLGE